MKKTKMHKIDKVFIIGIGSIAMIAAFIDLYQKVTNFPVYSCMSIYASYVLWLILLIYSLLKYKESQDKPQYVRWFMLFILPFLHIAFIIVGFIISGLLITLLGL